MRYFDIGEVIDENTKFVIFGVPWDDLSIIKTTNSKSAPQKIREITEYIGLVTEKGKKIVSLGAVDVGDVLIESKNDVNKNIKEIEQFIKELYRQKEDIVPIMVGGDHFCTFPAVKAVIDNLKKKDNIGVLIFDAHLDLYEKWDKSDYSHATLSHRIYDLEHVNNLNLLIVGSRDIDLPELKVANDKGITHFDAYLLFKKGLDNCIKDIINFFNNSNIENLYVSIDIDVLDPSIAPGTGFAVPGGFTYREMWKILKEISKNFKIIAFDLVEVSPNLDLPNKVTLNLAAKIIIEFISFIKNG